MSAVTRWSLILAVAIVVGLAIGYLAAALGAPPEIRSFLTTFAGVLIGMNNRRLFPARPAKMKNAQS